MPPEAVTSTATSSIASSSQQALQNLQSQATNAGNTFLNVYFAHLTGLEVVSVIVSAAFIVLIVWVAIHTGWYDNKVDRFMDIALRSDMPKKRAQAGWGRVEEHFFKGDENDLKIAIIEADKLLNEALRGVGARGIQLGDRLKSMKPGQIPNLDEVWQAHRLRNQIAHEPSFKLNRTLAERALDIYQKALENLGALDPAAADAEKK